MLDKALGVACFVAMLSNASAASLKPSLEDRYIAARDALLHPACAAAAVIRASDKAGPGAIGDGDGKIVGLSAFAQKLVDAPLQLALFLLAAAQPFV
jgi:hypothetical protein